MRNIAKEMPQDPLYGRKKYIIEEFICRKDLSQKNVLNIGCGFGWFEYYTKDIVDHIWSIEPDDSGLETAKKYLGGYHTISFKEGSAISLPFEDNSFDTVVSWDVIEHIPKGTEEKMIHEVNRVLKKEGVLYLTTPHKNPIGCLLDPAWLLIGHRHYSEEKMKAIIETTDLTVSDMYVRGDIWASLNMLNLYFAKWFFRRKPFFSEWFNDKENSGWKEKRGNFTLCVRAVKRLCNVKK